MYHAVDSYSYLIDSKTVSIICMMKLLEKFLFAEQLSLKIAYWAKAVKLISDNIDVSFFLCKRINVTYI